MKIIFFQRKPIPNFHFSVEIIFGDVKTALPKAIEQTTHIYSKFSQGLKNRLTICWETWKNKGAINHVTGDISFVGLVLPKQKTIQTILDCVFLENATGWKKKILKYFWLDMPVKRARFVTTISSQVKSEIVAHTGCNPDKIKVIPIAISPLYFQSAKPFNATCPNIMMTGSAPNKNTLRMIEALEGINCHVTIIGKQEPTFIEQFKKYKVAYTYKSGLSQPQMLEQFQQADILMFVSTYEGFGMPIIEAQAVGVPVLTSNISSMPEVAGKGACLADPYQVAAIKEGVNKIITDGQYRNEIVAEGLENVKKYNVNNIVNEYIALYQLIKK